MIKRRINVNTRKSDKIGFDTPKLYYRYLSDEANKSERRTKEKKIIPPVFFFIL